MFQDLCQTVTGCSYVGKMIPKIHYLLLFISNNRLQPALVGCTLLRALVKHLEGALLEHLKIAGKQHVKGTLKTA